MFTFTIIYNDTNVEKNNNKRCCMCIFFYTICILLLVGKGFYMDVCSILFKCLAYFSTSVGFHVTTLS